MRTLSPTALRSINAEQTDEVWLALLTIEHPDLGPMGPARLVNNTEPIVSRGMTFEAGGFRVLLPDEGPERPGEARIEVVNVDRRIVEGLRNLQSPPTVTIEIIIASNPDQVEASYGNLILRNASADIMFVQGVLSWEDITTEPIAELITPARFPGLF